MSRTLYDNHNINYAEWFEAFKEHCMDNDIDHTQYNENSERFINWLYDSLSMDWHDLMTNIRCDKNNNVDCIVVGSLGLWDGRHDIEPKHFPTLDKAINACINGCDYIVITENDGVINIKGIHHDGANNFEIHKLNAKGYDAYCDDKELNDEKYFGKFNFEF